MSGFTPGPWHAWMEGKTICVLGKERDHKKPVVTWMGFDGCNRTLEKQRANARLIAAAPKLFEALAELHRACMGQPVGGGDGGTYVVGTPAAATLNKANDALRKALGDQ